MGGLIVSIAMSRLPSLVQRAVLISPMLRNKCGIKSFNFNFPLPQPIARWLAMIACWAGLGSMHAFGFFNEKPSDSIDLNITTSDQDQSQVIQSIKSRYPETMSTCVTCDWIYQAIRAQRKFALRYDFVRTNTLIVAAGRDRFVYLRAMQMFQRKTTASRLMLSEEAHHDILHEKEEIRGAVKKVILDFFNQLTDSVYLVEPASPLLLCDRSIPLYSVTESVVRAVGLVFAGIGVVIGTAMIFGTSRRK
jgi:lysophospholipase